MRIANFALLLAALALASGAPAQELTAGEAEVVRDVAELHELLRPRPDLDLVDSALVFTNNDAQTALVHCVGFDANGRAVGRIRVKVPGNGLRFALASDLANGRDFLGSARCRTRNRVTASGFLLAPGSVSDLPANQGDLGGSVQIQYPTVASY